MKPTHAFLGFFLCLLLVTTAAAQENGNLQIHYMDVDQGDGAILISPGGETVMFDNGDFRSCDKPVEYLRNLGISKIISHYHSDHFGCTTEVLDEFPLQKHSYDRPGAYNSVSYRDYVEAVGSKRKHVSPGMSIVLDADTDHPVNIRIAGYNGAGIRRGRAIDRLNENDLNVVAVVHFGELNVMMAGDLSGYNTSSYKDVETVIARRVGQMEIYKTNHHGSAHSSNPTFLKKIKPRIAIVSAGDPNTHGHPAGKALTRIRRAGVEKVYWTSKGKGGRPKEGIDIVANGAIQIEMSPGATVFTVKYGAETDTYSVWPTPYKGKY